MLCLIILFLNLSCYFLDNNFEVGSGPVYVSLGGCVNITYSLSDNGSTIKPVIKSDKEILNLTDITVNTTFTSSQFLLLKYLHSFDTSWVVLCGIYPRLEEILIRFTVTDERGTNNYDSGNIVADYCTKSQRCKPWYLSMNGDGTYFPEKHEFTISGHIPRINLNSTIRPMTSGHNMHFGVCSYSDCEFINYFGMSEPHLVFEETQFQFRARFLHIHLTFYPYTQNNHDIFSVFYLNNKINIIRTRVTVTDILIPKPVYKSDSLVFNISKADIPFIKLEGRIFYQDHIFNINKTEYTYPSTMTIQLDPKETYAAIWLEFYVLISSRPKHIPIYMNIYIDLKTGIFATDKETNLPLNLPDLPKCR